MPILGLYGMTESAGSVTSQTLEKVKRFTAGISIGGIDLKIDRPDKDG